MNGQNAFTPRKALYAYMILGLILSALYMGNAPVVRAQETVTETPVAEAIDAQISGLEAAMIAAIEDHRANSADEFYYRLLRVIESGEWGVGEAEKIWKDTNEVIPADFSMVLGQKDENGNWRVVLPNEVDAYLDLIDIIPDLLLDNASKAHIKDAYSLSAQTTYLDHYLPWTKGSAAVVYQNYDTHGEGQLDFGFSGSIRTSKAGTLIFAYDAHTWSQCTGQKLSWCYSNYPHADYYNNAVVIKHADGEYSAYLHLQTDSIPAGIINNCNSGNGGNCAAVNIPVGTIIGSVGSIGLSTIAHLHFGTGNYVYGRCDYPDVYDEDGDGDTTETDICTGGITGGYGVSTSFHEKPYSATNCGNGAGQDPTLCMLYFPDNTNLFSQNPGGAFDDEFNSLILDPRWHWYNEDPTHWSLTASPGYLRIITQPKDIWRGNNNAPLLLQTLQPFLGDDFHIQTRIVITPTANHHQGGLVIYGDVDNYVRLTYAYIEGPTFEFAKEIGGNFQPIQVPAPPGINDFYLRIAKLGTNYSAYYSQDGASWTLIGTHYNVNISPLEVGLLAFNAVDVTSEEIPADFDYFRVTSDNLYTIAGYAGTSGVTINYVDGAPKNVTSASDGSYNFTVPFGWSGTVTPSRANYTFSPASRTYTNVVSHQLSQNYTATPNLKVRSSAAQDGWVLESTETSSQGGTMNATATVFNLGDDAVDRQYRSILSFNTSSLPDTAMITKVTLKIKRQGIVGTNPFNTHGGLKVDIRKPYFGGTAALAISDFQAATGLNAAATFNKTPAAGAWYSAVLSTAAYQYVNRTGLTQFRLRFAKDDNDDMGADYLKFYSGNVLTASYRPVLVIEYYVP